MYGVSVFNYSDDEIAEELSKDEKNLQKFLENWRDEKESTMRKFGISEFSTKPTNFYWKGARRNFNFLFSLVTIIFFADATLIVIINSSH